MSHHISCHVTWSWHAHAMHMYLSIFSFSKNNIYTPTILLKHMWRDARCDATRDGIKHDYWLIYWKMTYDLSYVLVHIVGIRMYKLCVTCVYPQWCVTLTKRDRQHTKFLGCNEFQSTQILTPHYTWRISAVINVSSTLVTFHHASISANTYACRYGWVVAADKSQSVCCSKNSLTTAHVYDIFYLDRFISDMYHTFYSQTCCDSYSAVTKNSFPANVLSAIFFISCHVTFRVASHVPQVVLADAGLYILFF